MLGPTYALRWVHVELCVYVLINVYCVYVALLVWNKHVFVLLLNRFIVNRFRLPFHIIFVCRQLTRHVRNLTRNPAKEDTLVGYLDILDLKCYLLPQWLLICITELRHEIQRYWVWIYAHKYVGYCECRKDRGDLWRRPVWHACILCMLQEPTFLHLLYIQTTISLLHARYPIHLFPFIFFP